MASGQREAAEARTVGELRNRNFGPELQRDRIMSNQYTMRISRLTVDNLGIKLYDKVSAVIAEMISNSYDADATKVSIYAPMNKYLATKSAGEITDQGFQIVIEDNGIGMTPDEMQSFFLVVGAERRDDPSRGDLSRKHRRKVMGRKGIGKLAPFGICKIIEVLSSGGNRVAREVDGTIENGYLTSHVILNYDDIRSDSDNTADPYPAVTGEFDGTLQACSGTKITLAQFNRRKVGDIDTLARQIAQRFGISSENWEVKLHDNTKLPECPDYSKVIGSFDVETMDNTRITFTSDEVIGPNGNPLPELKPGFHHDEDFYPVEGWVAYSKRPYKDDLMAGVRIYCRGKIAAQTAVFGRNAGFTGEYGIRSYLVGELRADWLDAQSDLIQTDRRDILWSDELGVAFQNWGQSVVRCMGKLARDPERRTTMETFLKTGNVTQRVRDAYPHEDLDPIRERAMDLTRMFGRAVKASEAENKKVVDELVNLSISLAPHVTLDNKLNDAANDKDSPIATLGAILRTARLAELSSFGSIAEKRVQVIDRLEKLTDQPKTRETGSEGLQDLIEAAPWLVNPEWTPVTANQSLRTLKTEFQKFYEENTGEKLNLTDFSHPTVRPDFILSSQEGVVEIIEIKRPEHSLTGTELDRIGRYYENMENFLDHPDNEKIRKVFADFHITLVCDKLGLQGTHKLAFEGLVQREKLTHVTWGAFLLRTKAAHRDFLREARKQRRLVMQQPTVRDAKDA